MALDAKIKARIDILNLQATDIQATCDAQCAGADRKKVIYQKSAVLQLAQIEEQIAKLTPEK